jgi:hypothetical protein
LAAEGHRIEQLPGQAHVDALALRLKLKAHRSHLGQVVLGQIGLLDKLLWLPYRF